MAEMKYVVMSERGHVIKGPHTFEVAVEIAGNLVKAGKVVSIEPCPDHHAELDEMLAEERMASKEYRALKWTGDNDDEARSWLRPDWEVESVTEHLVTGDRTLYVRTDNGLLNVQQGEFLVREDDGLSVYPPEKVKVVGEKDVTIATLRVSAEFQDD